MVDTDREAAVELTQLGYEPGWASELNEGDAFATHTRGIGGAQSKTTFATVRRIREPSGEIIRFVAADDAGVLNSYTLVPESPVWIKRDQP